MSGAGIARFATGSLNHWARSTFFGFLNRRERRERRDREKREREKEMGLNFTVWEYDRSEVAVRLVGET